MIGSQPEDSAEAAGVCEAEFAARDIENEVSVWGRWGLCGGESQTAAHSEVDIEFGVVIEVEDDFFASAF